jgi:hypothetical protein
VTLTVNSTLLDESVSWHHPISCSNNWKLPYQNSRTDLTIEIHRTDKTLCRSWPNEYSLLKYKEKHFLSSKNMRVAIKKSEIFRLSSLHLNLTSIIRVSAGG